MARQPPCRAGLTALMASEWSRELDVNPDPLAMAAAMPASVPANATTHSPPSPPAPSVVAPMVTPVMATPMAMPDLLDLGLRLIVCDDVRIGRVDFVEYPLAVRHQGVGRPRHAGDGRRSGQAKQSGQE